MTGELAQQRMAEKNVRFNRWFDETVNAARATEVNERCGRDIAEILNLLNTNPWESK